MKIRFGYVSHALALWDCSPAKTMTFTRWEQLNKQERDEKLYDVAKQNILHTNIQNFLSIAKELNQDFDIMIESKQKDLALFKLIEDLPSIRGIKRRTSAALE
ncbi:hypothetical protein COE51_07130 [Bacillus pseudomycoides]|nr:hypothetical protein COE51_07130 [Bacillus pseudomycoides]